MSLQFRGQVISTEREDGTSFMAPDVLIFRYPREQVTSKSIFIVQPTENCVVIIQGQVQAVLPPGTHNIQSPQNPLSSFMARFRYNQLPFDTIALFTSMTRHEVRIQGKSQTDDLVPLDYEVAVYYRVTDAAKLAVNIQFAGAFFKDGDLAAYLAPIIDQEVSSILNQVKLVDVYKKFGDISTAVTAALKQFLAELGVELISVRVTRLIPEDPELRRIIQLRDLGLEVEMAVRMGLARILTEQGNPASVNMAIGTPYYPNLSTLVNLPQRLFQVSMGSGKEGESDEQNKPKSS